MNTSKMILMLALLLGVQVDKTKAFSTSIIKDLKDMNIPIEAEVCAIIFTTSPVHLYLCN